MHLLRESHVGYFCAGGGRGGPVGWLGLGLSLGPRVKSLVVFVMRTRIRMTYLEAVLGCF